MFEAMEPLQRRLATRITAALAELETVGGYLVQSEENMAAMSRIIAEARAAFADPQYNAAVAEYVASYGATNKAVSEYVGSLGLGEVDAGTMALLSRQWKLIAAEYLTVGSNFTATLWLPISKEVGGYIATGSRYADLVRSVQGIVVGGEGLGRSEGAVLGYAKTAVNDLATVYERAALKTATDEVGAVFFLYQGRGIDTTRAFCKNRQGRYFHTKEVEAWGKDAAAGRHWNGMIEGTNASNVFHYLGGYNCRHLLIPVARRDVPKAEISRMVAAGYLAG